PEPTFLPGLDIRHGAILLDEARLSYPGDILHERSEEHTSELQSLTNLVCRLLLEKKKKTEHVNITSKTSISRQPDLTLSTHAPPLYPACSTSSSPHLCSTLHPLPFLPFFF